MNELFTVKYLFKVIGYVTFLFDEPRSSGSEPNKGECEGGCDICEEVGLVWWLVAAATMDAEIGKERVGDHTKIATDLFE